MRSCTQSTEVTWAYCHCDGIMAIGPRGSGTSHLGLVMLAERDQSYRFSENCHPWIPLPPVNTTNLGQCCHFIPKMSLHSGN